jgi:hypothetical protein
MSGTSTVRLPRVGSAAGRWVGVATVDLALHLAAPAWLALPAPWHPRATYIAVRSLGPFLGGVAIGHLLLSFLGDYLLVLATVSLLLCCGLPARHRVRTLRLTLSLSLPGTRTLVAGVLGLATLSVPLTPAAAFATTPGNSSGVKPALTWIGPAAAPPSMRMVVPDRRTRPGLAAGLPEAATSPPGTEPGASSTPGPAAAPVTTAPVTAAPVTAAPVTAAPVTAAPVTAAPVTAAPAAAPPAAAAPTTATDLPSPPTPGSTAAAPAAEPVPGEPAPTPTPATWIVQPGDHLWSIAARTLASANSNNPPDDEAIAAYWWQVVIINRPHLPNPADIDLLYPGDVVILPPLPAG